MEQPTQNWSGQGESDCLIKTKQSILFIYEAWHKVSEETIKNCWRHSGILNQLKTTETTEKIVQHKTIEEIKIHLSKFKT